MFHDRARQGRSQHPPGAAVVKERCGGDLLKGLTGELPGNGERGRHGWMMDGVKTEEVWFLGPLADGGAIIRDEQRGRRPGFYPSFV